MEKKISAQDLVSILCSTPGASIYYTLDNSNPSASSTLYEGPFSVLQDCTIKAIAIKTGLSDSNVASYEYDFFIAVDYGEDAIGYNEEILGYE